MGQFSLPKGYRFRLPGLGLPPEPKSNRGSRSSNVRTLDASIDHGSIGRRRVAPDRPLYLYLNESAYVATWVSGGSAPLNLASTYRSIEREGVFTPDEVQQYLVRGMAEEDFAGIAKFDGCKNVHFIDCTVDGKEIEHGSISKYEEDALLLCLSYTASDALMSKLGKAACVEITNFDALLTSLNEQLGIDAEFGPITYTEGSDRDHFTKSAADRWQDEYRLAWIAEENQPQIVQIPRGVALQVSL